MNHITEGRVRLEMLNMLVGGSNWEPMEGSREQRWRDHCFRYGLYHPDFDE